MFRKMLARLSGDAVSTSSSEEVAREKGMGEKQALLDKKSPQDQGEVDLSEKARGQGEMDGMGEEETLSLPAKPPW